MAIFGCLDRMCLALRPSGLWLCYAALQNLIPSFPWIAPPRPPPWRNPRKGRDQICHLATLPTGGSRGGRGRAPEDGASAVWAAAEGGGLQRQPEARPEGQLGRRDSISFMPHLSRNKHIKLQSEQDGLTVHFADFYLVCAPLSVWADKIRAEMARQMGNPT